MEEVKLTSVPVKVDVEKELFQKENSNIDQIELRKIEIKGNLSKSNRSDKTVLVNENEVEKIEALRMENIITPSSKKKKASPHKYWLLLTLLFLTLSVATFLFYVNIDSGIYNELVQNYTKIETILNKEDNSKMEAIRSYLELTKKNIEVVDNSPFSKMVSAFSEKKVRENLKAIENLPSFSGRKALVSDMRTLLNTYHYTGLKRNTFGRKMYRVKKGDTIHHIAEKNNSTKELIRKYNPADVKEGDFVVPGTALIIFYSLK